MADTTSDASLILDDFTNRSGASTYGTSWQGFTDRVMGGRSDMRAGIAQESGDSFLRMTGLVSLENNGGFIQARLPLVNGNDTLDARGFSGVELEVRGREGRYFVHLRTSRNRMPWSYYAAPVPVDAEWQTVRIPFDVFRSSTALRRDMPDLQRLQSIAIVAGTVAFEADIAVRQIALYR